MKKLILLIVLVVSIGLIPCWVQYGMFCLTTDFLNQQIGFIVETKRMLSSCIPFWSWNTFFGQDFIASYSFYTITSPFVWINCLCPVEYMMYSITVTLYLKLICIGLLTYTYLLKMGVTKDNATIGGLLFTFSSFVTISIGFYHFLEPILCFPLFLWTIEKYLRDEKNSVLTLGLSAFAVGFANFYFIPCTVIPALVYTCCRLGSNDVRLRVSRIVLGIVVVLLGLAMASFVLLPTILYIMGGERAHMTSFWSWDIADRIGSLFIPKLREGAIPLLTDTGWNSTAAYIAVFGILPASIYVWNKKNWLSLVLLILLFCYLTPLNGIFSLMTDVNYTRWAYSLSFFIVLATVLFFNERMNIQRVHILIFTILTLIVFIFRYYLVIWKLIRNYSLTGEEIGINLLTVLCLLTSFLSLLLLYKRQKMSRIICVVLTFSALQLACFTYLRSDSYCKVFNTDRNKIDLYSIYIQNNKIPYNVEQNTFRTDFITRQQPYYYANVSLIKNIPSVCSYNSIRSGKLSKLYQVVDSSSVCLPSGIVKNCNQISFDCMMSVRDVVQFKDPQSQIHEVVCGDKIQEAVGYDLYKFDLYLPFGFFYNSYILQSDIDILIGQQSNVDIPKLMLDNIAIQNKDEHIIGKYLSKGIINSLVSLDSVYVKRKQVTAYNTEWTTSGFTCSIDIKEPGLMFFSVPAEKGFTAKIDEEETNIYETNCGMCAILVDNGNHRITFTYIPLGLKTGTIISILSVLLLIVVNHYAYKKLQPA